METKWIGAQTLRFSRPPRVESFANIGAKLEGQGPLADYFDELSEDSFFGEKTWEKGEARMQKRVLSRALEKATRRPEELDLIFAGDLLNQCIGTSFALREFGVPLCGVYGACSTMGESLALAAMSIDGGFARRAAAMTSSHFCTAGAAVPEPVPYGSRARRRPVDGYGGGLLHPVERRKGPCRHARGHREDRGPRHHGREQHGRSDGARGV